MIQSKPFWVICFQILKVLNGLISVLLVPIFLSLNEQGLWFLILSFGSILLLFSGSQNGIALIFGAHEFRYLKISSNKIIGKEKDKNELLCFVKYSQNFFIFLYIIVALVVVVAFVLYIGNDNHINLIFIIYSLGLILFGLNYSILTYWESFGEIKQAYILKSFLMAFSLGLNILFLVSGFGLYSLACSMFFSMLIGFVYLFIYFYSFIKLILQAKGKINNLKKKVFQNYFSKNSFSMISGFLLFQIYTPIIYYFEDEVFAGKIGLSIAAFTALFAVTTSLLQVKLPMIINLIAHKRYNEASNIYFNINKKIIILYTFLMIIAIYILFNVSFFDTYKDRVVEFNSFIILALSWYFQLFVHIMVTYTRLFKRELFIKPTIFSVIYIIISTIFILKFIGSEYIFLGFLSSYLLVFPWIYIKYNNFVRNKK